MCQALCCERDVYLPWRQHRVEARERGLGRKKGPGASLVTQWLRICLLIQGTQVRTLVWEDLTCHGATKPVSHNY